MFSYSPSMVRALNSSKRVDQPSSKQEPVRFFPQGEHSDQHNISAQTENATSLKIININGASRTLESTRQPIKEKVITTIAIFEQNLSDLAKTIEALETNKNLLTRLKKLQKNNQLKDKLRLSGELADDHRQAIISYFRDFHTKFKLLATQTMLDDIQAKEEDLTLFGQWITDVNKFASQLNNRNESGATVSLSYNQMIETTRTVDKKFGSDRYEQSMFRNFTLILAGVVTTIISLAGVVGVFLGLGAFGDSAMRFKKSQHINGMCQGLFHRPHTPTEAKKAQEQKAKAEERHAQFHTISLGATR